MLLEKVIIVSHMKSAYTVHYY